MHASLREDFGSPFIGVVKTGRRGLRWHRTWSWRERRVPWNRVRSCTAGPDRRPGVPRHTVRLVLEYDDGLLEVILRGPLGALALAKLREAICTAANLHGE
jgi:hypothetical protein